MRLVAFGLAALAASTTASAQVYVHGYTTKNGTYVAPHYRSAPDHSVYNNWSTIGNVNPYTGQPGTRNPYGSYGSSTYGNSTYGSYGSRSSGSYGSSSYGSYGGYTNPYSSGST